MKALQILIYIRRNKFIMDLLDEDSINEAIAELEALQSRSCETCGYLGLDYCEQEICRNGDLDINIRAVYKNFCCNRHKPKEQ